jgi:glycosyltransferase involved in cell wall biosynthesis
MNKKINVLLISPLPPPSGGIASWTLQSLNWFKNSSVNLIVLNSNTITWNKNRLISIINKTYRTMLIIFQLLFELSFKKIELVHLNTSLENLGIFKDLIIVIISKTYNKKVIVHYRCNIMDQIQKSAYKPILLKKISKIAHVNICINNQSVTLLESFNRKCTYLPNFINESYKANKYHNDYVTKVLFVGHALQSKGILEIIKTAQQFNEIEFFIIGPFNDSIKSISPNNVVFIGEINREEISDYYNSADIFLFPSYSEGFANVILEAMNHALPIITTDVGSNKEILEEHGAIYCEIGSHEDIITAIKKLSNKENREKLGLWNQNKVNNYYEGKVLPKLLSIYFYLSTIE